jgi:energy-coupling factor transporter ATP-binding protein EcfA2
MRMLEATDLQVSFRRTLRRRPLQALAGVTLGVDRGGVLALLGPNGAGKSTLGHYIAGVALTFGLTLCLLLLTVALSLALGVPLQAGLVYIAFYQWCGMLVTLGWVTLLSVSLHPLVAGLIALLMQEEYVRSLSLSRQRKPHLERRGDSRLALDREGHCGRRLFRSPPRDTLRDHVPGRVVASPGIE